MESMKHFPSHSPRRPNIEEPVIKMFSPPIFMFDSPSLCLRGATALPVRFSRVNSTKFHDLVVVEFKSDHGGHVRMSWDGLQNPVFSNWLYFLGLEVWGATPATVQLVAVSRKRIHCEMECVSNKNAKLIYCMCTNIARRMFSPTAIN